MTKGKLIIVTLEDQMDAGLIEDTRIFVDGDRPICSAMCYSGGRKRYGGGKKRYSTGKPVRQWPCNLPATRTIKGKPYCQHHGPSGFYADPYYDSKEWRNLRQLVLERDNDTCQYCGNRAYQADHVHPRGKGGVDDPSNLVACCARCNRVALNAEFKSFEAKRQWILSQIKGRMESKNNKRPSDDLNLLHRPTRRSRKVT